MKFGSTDYPINKQYALVTILIKYSYLFRTPLVENDIRVPVQRFADSRESIDSMLAG